MRWFTVSPFCFLSYVHQGMSLSAISRALNLRGVPTKQNSTWANRQIKEILTNHTYLGKVRHCVKEDLAIYDGLHEGIVSLELFEEVKKIIAKNQAFAPTNQPKEKSYFSGMLTCKCKRKMFPHSNRGKTRYTCAGNKFGVCNASSMSHEKVEAAFSQYIERVEAFSEIDALDLKKKDKVKQEVQQATSCGRYRHNTKRTYKA